MVLITAFGYAQHIRPDTVLKINEVVVEASRAKEFSAGNKTLPIDSAVFRNNRSASLSDVLSLASPFFIKSYGAGSLATISIRGTSAAHTAVLWNGFNVQSPMNGVLDLALIPAAFLDEVSVQHGGSAALFGSGAMGGVIHLNNANDFNAGKRLTLGKSYGSFNEHQQYAIIQAGGERITNNTRIFHHSAANNFAFVNTAQYENPLVRQKHAELLQYGLLQENTFKLNDNQQLSFRFWYQDNERNIPPLMTSLLSKSFQGDKLYRTTLEWQRKGEKVLLSVRNAFFDETILYNDSLIGLYAFNRAKTLISEVETRGAIRGWGIWNAGLNNTYINAIADGYKGGKMQNRTAFFSSGKFFNKENTIKASVSLRQEFVEGKPVPFTTSAGIEGVLSKNMVLKGNLSKNYRLPTMNDLFWMPGGNPDLRPEAGWSEELGVAYKAHSKQSRVQASVTLFNMNVNDWITWAPVGNSVLWSPQNINSVWARGLEFSTAVHAQSNKIKISFNANYHYTLSTNQKSSRVNDQSLHKQLLYVPVNSSNVNAVISYKKITLGYYHVYTGTRYTSSDNQLFLSPYQVASANLSGTLTLFKTDVRLYIQVNNLWNETYQVLAWRAMPLRNYQVGMSVQLNKSKNNNP